MNKNQDERAFYRNEIKEKNKEIVKICYYNGGNYQGCFVEVQKAIIGEYALNKFNERYNADTTKKHKSIVNYLSLENLKEYLEKLELIINEAKFNDISISNAIHNLKLQNALTPIINLQLDENILNKANKKAKELDKNVKNSKVEKLVDEDELKEELEKEKDNKSKTKKTFDKVSKAELTFQKQFYEDMEKEKREKEKFEKFIKETDYETDDYYDYVNKTGDYADEDEEETNEEETIK